MSNNLIPSPLTMDSIQVGQSDVGLIRSGMDYSTLHQSTMKNLQIDIGGGGLSDMRSQQMSLSKFQLQGMENGMSLQLPVSSYQLPLTHPRLDSHISHNLNQSNLLMVQAEQQMLEKVQGQTMPFRNHPGEIDSMFKLQPSSILAKRKASDDITSEALKWQQVSAMNKRVIPVEHQPWLQSQLRKHYQQTHPLSNAALSPRNPPLPAPKKSQTAVAPQQPQPLKRSVPPKAGQISSSPKESFDSVRSKLRDSLSSALKAAQRKDHDSKASSDTNSVTAETQKHPQNVEVTNNSSQLKSLEDNSVNKPVESLAESPAAMISTGKGFPQIISLTEDDVTFSDSLFVKDELLQGNGLAWVMESDVMLTNKKNIETGITQDLTNEDTGSWGSTITRVRETPETLAHRIEAELFKLFGGVNKKYKEKGRSLLFNLKDRSNPELGESVLSGEISPERLCSMTAEELASKELSQWRIAKAEELAQMVVLPDTDVDIRRLVKKTHKGEFQVELEEPQNFSVQITPGSNIVAKDKATDTVPDDADTTKRNSPTSDEKSNPENLSSYTLTIPPTEGNDLMQGLMVDDELKDAEFLPPIVSLDEFMESLDSEPPFEDLPKDADDGSESKSPTETPNLSAGALSKEQSDGDVLLGKHDSAVKSGPVIKGERIWDGLLQLNVAVVSHVTGVLTSGEQTSAKEWPCLIEVKGRVKLEAFGKFLQELPLSRSRAVMVLHFVCRSGTSESDLASLREVANSYMSDGRVGFAEPSPGAELYVCPAHGKTSEILNVIFPKKHQELDAVDPLDTGLIGVVVWRKVSSISPKSASNHKHNSRRQHLASRRPQDNVSKSKHPSRAAPPPKPPKQPQPPVEPDVDVPPGFGPQDEDDLPEFNFASAETHKLVPPPTRRPQVDSHSILPARPVDQIRQLIHKYGQTENKPRQTWNDDDDDDMPEWRPEDTSQRHFPAVQSLYNHQTSQPRQQQNSGWPSTNSYKLPPGYGGMQWPDNSRVP